MNLDDAKAPAAAIWALGATQILGYGTLYYSFPILAPAMAAEFGVPEYWVFAALSAALFIGSLLAPTAGRLADRHGAGVVMTVGSAAAGAALAICALAPERWSFAAALVAMELASCFVLYATAFVAIVQIGAAGAARSITHLTLIAGFASTLFWPLTTFLHAVLDWREVYLIFAGVNLLICLPIHAWLARLARRRSARLASVDATAAAIAAEGGAADPARERLVFPLILAGFAITGFVLSAVLVHMVPLLTGLGLGTAGVLVSTFFGPSQVASRLVNMVFGGRLRQTWLAAIAAGFLTAGLILLVGTAPQVAGTAPQAAGIAAFVILFGLGSGLLSIVGGTLPLEVFGRKGYGARVGWTSAARQFTSAFAPFAFSLMLAGTTTTGALSALSLAGLLGVAVFSVIAMLAKRPAGGTVHAG